MTCTSFEKGGDECLRPLPFRTLGLPQNWYRRPTTMRRSLRNAKRGAVCPCSFNSINAFSLRSRTLEIEARTCRCSLKSYLNEASRRSEEHTSELQSRE